MSTARDTMRFDPHVGRVGRARRTTARIDLRLPIFVAAVLAVFACCFALGRATGGSGSSSGEPGSSLPTSFQSAAAPLGLSAAAPLAIPTALAVLHRHVHEKSAPVANGTSSASAKPLAREAARASLGSSQPSQPARPVSSPSVEAPSVPTAVPTSSGRGSSGRADGSGNSKPATGGGGSFDSSG
jgi:hypothetical protein